jgi:hypothetical protein
MDLQEIIEILHRIRRELSSNYEDLDLVESCRKETCDVLKEALILLGEED